jgi:ubiquinone/menaquinone biosynthesis C-methylase UbiE
VIVMLKGLFLLPYAATYDVFNGPAERAGLREQRHDLLAQATGATIEIGAGTGLNLTHYPPAVTRLALIEPDAYMSRRLRRRAAQLGRDAEILDATADQLPFPDASFDTAVVSFTLCSVPDEQAALSEITRVLAPGGLLLFFEHWRAAEGSEDRKDHDRGRCPQACYRLTARRDR